MSGPLLRYPEKPQDVTDDIESFVHVINYLTLRFLHHSLTKSPHANPEPGQEQAIRAFSHARLSRLVNNLFFDEIWSKQSNTVTGGYYKFSIYSSSLDFPYPPTGDTAFSVLFGKLSLLCREHYQSTAVLELEIQYGCPIQEKDAPPPFPDSTTAMLGGRADNERLSESESEISDDENMGPPVVPVQEPRPDPFETHKALYNALRRALKEMNWLPDKIHDQFEALLTNEGVHNRAPSIQLGKRNLTSSRDARPDGQRMKKAKIREGGAEGSGDEIAMFEDEKSEDEGNEQDEDEEYVDGDEEYEEYEENEDDEDESGEDGDGDYIPGSDEDSG